MIEASNITLRFGKRVLFEEVNIKFNKGNCYGIIGANGAGKSTFLKILSGDQEADKGEVIIEKGKRLAVLKQNQNEFNDVKVIDTVIMGHKRLSQIMKEKDALYAKADFNDADGMKAAELESEFAELNGWEAESDAGNILSGLGIGTELHEKLMKELEDGDKVKVLLAQALFGNPDILILDEPTNGLEIEAINWLENFLADFENTVIVVSHDRHFLNQVCTHICDIDYSKITLFMGNYDFWYQSSQLILSQMHDSNKKKEQKIKELQEFIARFSANASKAKQATSRKKLLDKINLDDIKISSRKYPYIHFKQNREAGRDILTVKNLSKIYEGEQLLSNVNFTVHKGDKIALVGPNGLAKTMLFKLLNREEKFDSGEFIWGTTITTAYLPKDNSDYFKSDLNLVNWLRQYTKDQEETFVRGFLGRMLFSGEESLKKANVLSGGEKVRCMLAKMMLNEANVLMLDEPTNHLDLEAITALNNALVDFPGTLIFVSKDHQFLQTIANRIIEVDDNGIRDMMCSFDEYIEQKHSA